MWTITERGRVWTGGQFDWTQAAEAAASCGAFVFDCEEECVHEDERSCYNCRYRRWTRESFVCMKEMPK